MNRYSGTKYASRWDYGTWLVIILVLACCILPYFLGDDGVVPIIISLLMLVFLIVAFKGLYYRISGDQLIVYQFFVPTAFPISKIKEIRPTKSFLAGPAASLIHRLAITFTDRSVMKGMSPLIISPAHREDFIRQLTAINPKIDCRSLSV